MGHCDLILAAESAYLSTPFTALGQSAEAASSYTFPKMMGKMQATAMIMFNKKMWANEVIYSRMGLTK